MAMLWWSDETRSAYDVVVARLDRDEHRRIAGPFATEETPIVWLPPR